MLLCQVHLQCPPVSFYPTTVYSLWVWCPILAELDLQEFADRVPVFYGCQPFWRYFYSWFCQSSVLLRNWYILEWWRCKQGRFFCEADNNWSGHYSWYALIWWWASLHQLLAWSLGGFLQWTLWCVELMALSSQPIKSIYSLKNAV